MVSVKAAPPAATEAGLRLVIVGSGGMMLKVNGADVPPAAVTVTLGRADGCNQAGRDRHREC